MEEFKNKNTRILICKNTARMGVNIQYMTYTIQWKILDYLVFIILF